MNYKRGRPKAKVAKKAPVIPEVPRVYPGRKDTKRWCRGKVGREHRLHWQPAFRGWGEAYEEVCSACRKRLRYCAEYPWLTTPCVCGNHRRTGHEARLAPQGTIGGKVGLGDSGR